MPLSLRTTCKLWDEDGVVFSDLIPVSLRHRDWDTCRCGLKWRPDSSSLQQKLVLNPRSCSISFTINTAGASGPRVQADAREVSCTKPIANIAECGMWLFAVRMQSSLICQWLGLLARWWRILLQWMSVQAG